MDSPNFCGQSCHVMAPQWAAYQVSPHSHVACVECHIGSGFSAAVQAKVNGTKQLVEVTLGNYPRPILAPLSVLRPARATCEECHSPTRFVGEKLLVETMYGDDEKNSVTHNVLALHLGGVDSLSHLQRHPRPPSGRLRVCGHRLHLPDDHCGQQAQSRTDRPRSMSAPTGRGRSRALPAGWTAWTAITRRPTPSRRPRTPSTR